MTADVERIVNIDTTPSREDRSEWRVEEIYEERDGEVMVTLFSGPEAAQRALNYATWRRSWLQKRGRIVTGNAPERR